VKKYDISAINVEISLNQWLDFYPGYMYVLTENLEKVRAEEAKNKAGRENEKDQFDTGAVTNGLQGDYIQPLVIRGNQGDCVKIVLRNALEGGEAVSLHIHGSSMIMSGTGKPATTTNPDAIVAKGKSADMEWYIHPSTQEGGRQFHTYSNDRELTVMGLFGTFVVEPRGSKYLDPLGKGEPTEMASGWQAIIQNGAGPDFREFVIIYHEVGDEAFRPVNKKGDFLPQRDPLTDTYRPGARALHYRSGPSETFDLDTECGSGLCQQLAGDFLFHCHVAHHYVSGMWGYWRVYNTMQEGDVHNDVMPDLRELPDRKGRMKAGISSDKLIGK